MVRALETFGIPFLCYSTDGERGYVSPAGEELLRLEPLGVTVGAQADHAVAELSWSNAPVPIGQFALVREIPGWTEGIVLAVHIARQNSGPCSAVIVIRPSPDACTDRAGISGLTPRETDVARLLAAGLATKAIAFRLGISTHTTRHHTEQVFEKLGVRTRSAVAALLGGRAVATTG